HGVIRALADEGDVAPGVCRQLAGVVIGAAQVADVLGGDMVPLLAGDLAGLAADADAAVGEEADRACRRHQRVTRPGRMSQVAAFTSWMCTFGSSTIGKRSFA